MPVAPPKPCTKGGCYKMATIKSRCEDHQIKHGWNHTKSRHERGYDSAWYKLKAKILDRDGHLCIMCAKEGIYTPSNEVDHIIPKSKGGTDDYSNLQSICRRHHKDKTQSESAAARRGTGGV